MTLGIFTIKLFLAVCLLDLEAFANSTWKENAPESSECAPAGVCLISVFLSQLKIFDLPSRHQLLLGVGGSLGVASTGPSEAAALPALVETCSKVGQGPWSSEILPRGPSPPPLVLLIFPQVDGPTPHSRGHGVCWSPFPSTGSFPGASVAGCILATPLVESLVGFQGR